ncbi:hypothetical protein ACHAWF_018311 [Thalassiosira exigua]
MVGLNQLFFLPVRSRTALQEASPPARAHPARSPPREGSRFAARRWRRLRLSNSKPGPFNPGSSASVHLNRLSINRCTKCFSFRIVSRRARTLGCVAWTYIAPKYFLYNRARRIVWVGDASIVPVPRTRRRNPGNCPLVRRVGSEASSSGSESEGREFCFWRGAIMEPPSEFRSHGRHWEEPRHHSPQQRPRQQQQYQQEHQPQPQPQPQGHYRVRDQSSTRGRSSSRQQRMPAHDDGEGDDVGPAGGASRPRSSHSQSTSNTPRRKGNPQSASPSLDGSRPLPRVPHPQAGTPPTSASPRRGPESGEGGGGDGGDRDGDDGGAAPSLTPLSALTAILTAHASHRAASLAAYRQSHSLHRHASDRAKAAAEKLRLAEAEAEHAETAEEYAREELARAAARKDEAAAAAKAMTKRVRALSRGLAGRRVRLIGLSKNAGWNGRTGTIAKLVADGEDAGRWKVRLDPEWRGRDAEGRRMRRMDTATIADDNGDQGTDSQQNAVVAKAENLQLVNEDGSPDDDETDDVGAWYGDSGAGGARSASRSASRSRSASSQRRGRQEGIHPSRSIDPEQEEFADDGHHPHRPPRDPSSAGMRTAHAFVTPESGDGRGRSGYKNIAPTSYYKSETGRYHESPPRRSQSNQRQQQQQRQQLSGASHPRDPGQGSPPGSQTTKPTPFKLSPPRDGPRNARSSSSGRNKNTSRRYETPIRRSPSNDSARLSSAFSRMLLSPVSFTPVSFNPEPSDSFQKFRTSPTTQWIGQQQQSNFQRQGNNSGSGNGWKPYNDSPGEVSLAGSLFDEVTSLEKNMFPYPDEGEIRRPGGSSSNVDDVFCHRDYGETSSDPQLQPYPSHDVSQEEEDPRHAGLADSGDGLPTIVVLPVPEDDFDNPYLSPGHHSSSPPHCVGVQNAGVRHINGVYLLAHPKDEQGHPAVEEEDEEGEGPPPLYFRDGPPVLLPDGRRYDMCILRIACPDSPDHVIWFLAKVDVDPDCLDVKFSDCYYYCRMLRNDDGRGGEREGGCRSPPGRGWNVPRLPPGAEELRVAQSSSFSTAEDVGGGGARERGRGRGPTGPRAAFASPGEDSGVLSQYSI